MKFCFIDKVLRLDAGKSISAAGKIPKEAEFFKDHFPGFPVLPGVLALEMLRQTAECYYRALEKDEHLDVTLKQISAVKFSNYLKPGDEWESHLELTGEEGLEGRWLGRLLYQGQAAVSARLVLVRQPLSERGMRVSQPHAISSIKGE